MIPRIVFLITVLCIPFFLKAHSSVNPFTSSSNGTLSCGIAVTVQCWGDFSLQSWNQHCGICMAAKWDPPAVMTHYQLCERQMALAESLWFFPRGHLFNEDVAVTAMGVWFSSKGSLISMCLFEHCHRACFDALLGLWAVSAFQSVMRCH